MMVPINYDSFPFGMLMPGRVENSSQYRFGFNNMEKDDEISGNGNSYDFGARIYNPRIGRWLSLDKAASEYPSLSDYSFVANSPIVLIDPDGNRIKWFVQGKRKRELKAIVRKLKNSDIFKYVWKSYKASKTHDLHITAGYVKKGAKASTDKIYGYKPESLEIITYLEDEVTGEMISQTTILDPLPDDIAVPILSGLATITMSDSYDFESSDELAETFAEEIIHAFQYMITASTISELNNSSPMSVTTMNIEYEAKYIVLLILDQLNQPVTEKATDLIHIQLQIMEIEDGEIEWNEAVLDWGEYNYVDEYGNKLPYDEDWKNSTKKDVETDKN